MDKLFKGLFDTTGTEVISVSDFLFCVGCAIACGIFLAICYLIRTRHTRGFLATLAILPSVVCVVIMMVNGNVGAGVAVAGAFSLVRFRSAPGSAREISAIFIAMGVGLVCGMGYIGYAILITLVLGLLSVFYNVFGYIFVNAGSRHKTLRITIPEDLNYSEAYTPLLKEYTTSLELVQVKTTNMGSMFRLTYNVTLKKGVNEKELIDKLRCTNGNLEIVLSRQETSTAEL